MNTEKRSDDTNRFYNEVSSFYDEMTGFEESLKRRVELFRKIIPQDVKSIADVGCGTGLDTIAMSQLGYSVTGFDPSEKMIAIAEEKMKAFGQEANFVVSSANGIADEYSASFNYVISLGNTFANIPPGEFNTSIKKISQLLKPGGRVLIQVLNYEAILENKERIVNITRRGDSIYVRFYDFYGEHINFNILKFSPDNPANRKLLTSTVYSYTTRDFSDSLTQAGFTEFRFSGSLMMEEFDKLKSKDLVITASKVGE